MPWKYGFKSIKSIVRIRFVERQPQTAWSIANPSEYGFYSNVNPEVDHPRWSQAREKRLPSLFATTQDADVQRLRRSGRVSVRGNGPTQKLLKAVVFVLALGPAAWLVRGSSAARWGPIPPRRCSSKTGIWAFRFLIATLAVTPVRRVTTWNVVIRYRRMLGLFAFFYGTLHLLTYVVFDHFFAWEAIVADIVKRPFITAGMAAFVLMVPLAITSTKGWIRRLGRRWQLLHRLIYISAVAAALHFIWKVKVVIGEPVWTTRRSSRCFWDFE